MRPEDLAAVDVIHAFLTAGTDAEATRSDAFRFALRQAAQQLIAVGLVAPVEPIA